MGIFNWVVRREGLLGGTYLNHGTISPISLSQDSRLVGDSLKAEKELTASVTEVCGE
jgi:hypothetical protein